MRVAVIGSGIAGLGSAWLLRQQHHVTLFEADSRPGGHTHTVDIPWNGRNIAVDTGFLVCNDWTYPHLLGLFAEIGIETAPSNMSFSVRIREWDLEWSGTDLAALFAQRRNLARPRFWNLLRDILRFNRDAKAWLRSAADDCTLGEFLQRGGYGLWFREGYLLPMAAAIWSCPVARMADYPARSLLHFYENHGLLNVFRRPQWRTVRGGGREYVQRILAQLPDVRLGQAVSALRPAPGGGILVHTAAGAEHFDLVVSAVHSDQAETLVRDSWPAAADALSAIPYQENQAWLHHDRSFLPKRKAAWSAWNFHQEQQRDGQRAVAVSYLINRLQPLDVDEPIIVTLNPEREPEPTLVWRRIQYAHPVFDRAALGAQEALRARQGTDGLYFAGAWLGHGFHEDGLRSAVAIANALGILAPWQDAAESCAAPKEVLCPQPAL
ncbi:NAD(P)/FAD-dependent oxidoreductase [Acidithiobacillus caldus]